LESFLASSDQISAVDHLLTQLSNKELFDEDNWRQIWQNNRFEYMIRSVSHDFRIVGKLYQMGCYKNVPPYIPQDIALKINKFREDEADLEIPPTIENFEHFAQLLRTMRRKNKIPNNFKGVFTDSIETNENLFESLQELEILSLFKWDSDSKVFPEAIEMNLIIKAVDIIDELEANENKSDKPIDVKEFHIRFDEEAKYRRSNSHIEDIVNVGKIQQHMKSVFGDSNRLVDLKEFVKLNAIIEKPTLTSVDSQQTVANVIPYIMQKIKMWGCSAITADNISSLLSSEPNTDSYSEQTSAPKNRPRFGKKVKESSPQTSRDKTTEQRAPFSRLDTIVGLLNSVDAIVGQDLLNIIAKFPYAMPLIINQLSDQDSFKVCFIARWSFIKI